MLDSLCDAAERVAKAQSPEVIRKTMRVSCITALKTPDNKVREISSAAYSDGWPPKRWRDDAKRPSGRPYHQ